MSYNTDSSYTEFSKIYDIFMEDVPYEKWKNQITDILYSYDIKKGIIADLGCGTGTLTRLMADAGFDMIGIDNSADMLSVALEKSCGEILYLLQDMREFELYGTCAAIISRCDCINYIIEDEDLIKVFKLVNNYLDPGGLFIFDINSIYKYEHELSGNIMAENTEYGSYICENYYDFEAHINEYMLTIYMKTDEDLYYRHEEVHYQRAYGVDEIKSIAENSGLEFINVYDADTGEGLKDDSHRILFVFKEKNKLIKEIR